MIQLTEGGEFDEIALINHIRETGLNYIIQGQQAASQDNHTKPNSLDYWLRPLGINPNTKQADNIVIDALVDTGFFEIILDLQCPDSGALCKGVGLIET